MNKQVDRVVLAYPMTWRDVALGLLATPANP